LITVNDLADRARQAQARYEALRVQFPPGTVHAGRNDAYREAEEAAACATWMAKQGIDRLVSVVPFSTIALERGAVVRIAKGARIFSTHPSVPREGLQARCAQQVKLHFIDRGYVDGRSTDPIIVQGKVQWAGTGGYWRWTDINNVEPV
jgi:hypothetical protein